MDNVIYCNFVSKKKFKDKETWEFFNTYIIPHIEAFRNYKKGNTKGMSKKLKDRLDRITKE